MRDLPLEITCSRHFPAFLAEQRLSLVFTTYQASKVFFIGLNGERLSLHERSFTRCMGLAASPETVWLSSGFQIWRLENCLDPGVQHEGYDRLFVPRVAYTTGDVDAHDMAVEASGRLVFANTLFSCVATLSETHSFVPVYKPSFVSKLAAEDRCHLNGLALKDGHLAYVTATATTDAVDAWRDKQIGGGVLISTESDAILAENLSMPHSPRYHDGELYLLESGTGYLGRVDLKRGAFERLVFCPGYARGLAFYGRFAVVALSLGRHNRSLDRFELAKNLERHSAAARSGLLVIDLRSGDVVHWLRLEGVVQELFDVAILPGVRRPMALGIVSDEIKRVISIG